VVCQPGQPAHPAEPTASGVQDFTSFAGVERPEEMRQVTRAHLIAWRKDLERRGLAPSSTRRKLAAIASLFDGSVGAAISSPIPPRMQHGAFNRRKAACKASV
jgi:site-specific recombinase XerD